LKRSTLERDDPIHAPVLAQGEDAAFVTSASLFTLAMCGTHLAADRIVVTQVKDELDSPLPQSRQTMVQ